MTRTNDDNSNGETESPPPQSEYLHLRPSNWMGAGYIAFCSALTAGGIWLATFPDWRIWLISQFAISIAMVQWFILLHEAGHKTLFRNARCNEIAGHLSSLFAIIPFESWKRIHGMHHHWTGWQDLDATTASLVPRRLKLWEKIVINVCWRLWIPLFSILYRTQNYWNLPRLMKLFPERRRRKRLAINFVFLLIVYAAVFYFVGWFLLLQWFGLAILLTFVVQDILILSQHTHIPMEVSNGEKVKPFKPAEQEVFTRSLRFPRWFSCLFLLNFDAHELHHIYTSVPGYYLHRINYQPHNEIAWLKWIWAVKKLPGEVFLFKNANQTGFNI